MRLIGTFIISLSMLAFMPETLAQGVPQQEAQPQQEKIETPLREKARPSHLEGGIRGFVWGLPPTVILENEKATFVGNDEGILFFLDEVWGERATIGYEFMDNKLYRAKIFIEKEYSNRQRPLDDLMRIRADLVKTYGEPVSEKFVWHNEREKNFPPAWGWAIFRSELEIIAQWQDEETLITAYLGSPKIFETELSVTYESYDAKKALETEAAKDFLILP